MRVVAIRGGCTIRFDRFEPPAQHDLLRAPAQRRLPGEGARARGRNVRRKIACSIEAGRCDSPRTAGAEPARVLHAYKPARMRDAFATGRFECLARTGGRNMKERDVTCFARDAGAFAPEAGETIEFGADDLRTIRDDSRSVHDRSTEARRKCRRTATAARHDAQGARDVPAPAPGRVRGFSRAARQAGSGVATNRATRRRAADGSLTARAASRDGRCRTLRNSCRTACPARGRGSRTPCA